MSDLIRAAIEQIKAVGHIHDDTLKHMTAHQVQYANEQALREDAA